MSEPLIVIGNGMAAARFAEELSSQALGRYAMAVIGAEPVLAYNRVLLSSLLAGEVEDREMELKPRNWWRAKGVTLLYGRRAEAIDLQDRRVALEGGVSLPFAKLVFATGSSPIRLDVPGGDLAGVLTFRDRADVDLMLRSTRKGTKAAVIGGGLLGLEAASGLARAGAEVTVIHLMDRLMERQLDARAAVMLRQSLEQRGIEVLLQAETVHIEGDKAVEGLRLADGRLIPADLVIMAAGIRPNTELARAAGLAVNRGIIVDDALAASVSGIFAIGECAEHRGNTYGLVEPAYEQARVLAARLAGKKTAYHGSILATNLKVSGINVFSAGDFLGAADAEEIILTDPGLGSYRKLVIKEDRLVGAVLFGDASDGLWYLDLMRSGAPVEAFRDDLVFGRALVERQAA